MDGGKRLLSTSAPGTNLGDASGLPVAMHLELRLKTRLNLNSTKNPRAPENVQVFTNESEPYMFQNRTVQVVGSALCYAWCLA